MRYPIKTARALKNIKSNDALARELIDAYPDEFEQFKQGNERSLGTKLGELDRGKTSWWRNPERTEALARLMSHLDLDRDDLAVDRGAGQDQLTLSSFPQFPPLHLQREMIWQIGKPQFSTDSATSLPSPYRSEPNLGFWLRPDARGISPSRSQWLWMPDSVEFDVLTQWLAAVSRHHVQGVARLSDMVSKHIEFLIRPDPLIVVLHGQSSDEELALLLIERQSAPMLIIGRDPLPQLPAISAAPSRHKEAAPAEAAIEAWVWTLLPNWRVGLLDWIEQRMERRGVASGYASSAAQTLLDTFDHAHQWFVSVDDVLVLCQALSERRERKLTQALETGTDTATLLELLFNRDQAQLGLMQDLVTARWSCWRLPWSGALERDEWLSLSKRKLRFEVLLSGGLIVPDGHRYALHRQVVVRLLLRAHLIECMRRQDLSSWAPACFDADRRPFVDAALDALSDGVLAAVIRTLIKACTERKNQGAAEAVLAALGRRLVRGHVNAQLLSELVEKMLPMLGKHDGLHVPLSRPWSLPAEMVTWMCTCWAVSLHTRSRIEPSWQFPGWSDDLQTPPTWLDDFGRPYTTYAWARLGPLLQDFLKVVRRWLSARSPSLDQATLPLMLRMALLAEAAHGGPSAESWWWYGVIGDAAAEQALLEHVMPVHEAGIRTIAFAWWPSLVRFLREKRESNKSDMVDVPLFSRHRAGVTYSPLLAHVMDSLKSDAAAALKVITEDERSFLANNASALPPSFQGELLRCIAQNSRRVWQRWEAYGFIQQFSPGAIEGLVALLPISVLGEVAAQRIWEWAPDEGKTLLRAHRRLPSTAVRHLVMASPSYAIDAVLVVQREAPEAIAHPEWRQWALRHLPNARQYALEILALLEPAGLQVVP